MSKPGVLVLLACLPASLLADFSYEQSTKITGGMMAGVMKFAGAFSKQAREPLQSTVAIKGNRMFNGNKDHAQVIDLDSETITEINLSEEDLQRHDVRGDEAAHGTGHAARPGRAETAAATA